MESLKNVATFPGFSGLEGGEKKASNAAGSQVGETDEERLRPGRAALSVSISSTELNIVDQGRSMFMREVSASFGFYSMREAYGSAEQSLPTPAAVVKNVLSEIGAGLARTQQLSGSGSVASILEGVSKAFDVVFDRVARQYGDTDEIAEELRDGAIEARTGVQNLENRYPNIDRDTRLDGVEDGRSGSGDLSLENFEPTKRSNDFDGALGNRVASVSSLSELRSRGASFNLVTQDGDRVEISFSDVSASSVQLGRAGGSGELSVLSAYDSRFAFSVSGNLDEGELDAINNLLSQLNEVSASFFAGDFVDAFEKALGVGFDGSEIARFSLDLSQVQVDQFSSYSNVPSNAVKGGGFSRPLVSAANQVVSLMDSVARFQVSGREITGFLMEALDLATESVAEGSNKFPGELEAFLSYLGSR